MYFPKFLSGAKIIGVSFGIDSTIFTALDEVQTINVKNIGIKLVELENEIQLIIKENRKVIQVNFAKQHEIDYYKKYINSLII